MPHKLRRTRSVFRKRRVPPAVKVLGSIVLCLGVMAGGFLTAKWATENAKWFTEKKGQSDTETIQPLTPPPSNKPGGNANRPNDDKEDVVTPGDNTPDTPASLASLRGFYLPFSALQSDTLPATLSAAHKAGFNAVLFDLKDADGNLYYQFSTPEAKKIGYATDSLTAEELTALFDLMRENGLQPIPRLYAFRDDVACAKLTDARISYVENHSWAWYDGEKAKGAKKWLNPYSATAQGYIQGLAEELKNQGAAAVMLEGVQFPDKLTAKAYLGDTAATVSKSDALAAFVAATRTRLGADCPVLLGCSAHDDVTNAKLYGSNPLTFGATIASPLLSSKVQESVEKMVLRTQVLEENKKPLLAPMLSISNLTDAKVSDTLSACIQGGANGFILYHPDGKYDFAAYDLP